MKTGCFTALGLLLGLLIFAGCASPRGNPDVAGVPNFHRVNDRLFRGAQPTAQGVEALRVLGVKTVINLRMADDVWPDEASVVHASGMTYVNIPLPGLSAPTQRQVAEVLSLIEESPAPVFLHCQHGADRTGTVVACYRISHDGWTAEQALDEAKGFGMSWVQAGMRRFVRAFARERAEVYSGPPG